MSFFLLPMLLVEKRGSAGCDDGQTQAGKHREGPQHENGADPSPFRRN